MSTEGLPKKLRPDDLPSLTICGYPRPGEIIWTGRNIRYRMSDDGYMYLIEDEDPYKPSLGERIAAKLLCPACLLPRFFPGHGFRGCNGDRYSF